MYTHKRTGNKYEVIYIAVDVDTNATVVVYKSLAEDDIWTRDINIFNEKFERIND